MIHFALQRMVPVRSRQQQNPARGYCTHRPAHRRTPIRHVLQQGIEDNNIELPDIGRKVCRVSYDPREYLRIRQAFATPGARNELRVKINAGDFAAAGCPVHAPRAGSTADIQNIKRPSPWK